MEELQQKAIAVIDAQRSLEQSEAFKNFMREQKRIADMIVDLKAYLKKEMVNQNINEITSPNGPSDWTIKLSHRHTAKVTDSSLIPDDYFTEEEIQEHEISVHDGKVFKLTPNTQLAKNNMELGVSVDGFELVDTPAISIKIDGKAV